MSVTANKKVSHKSWRLRIGLPASLVLVFLLISALGYQAIEDYTWVDSLYMATITISTVGYGTVSPLSDGGKLWSMFVIAGGVALGVALATQVGAFIVEGQIRHQLGRRSVERKIASLKGHIVICGYGRTGAMIAERLEQAGKTFVAVDIDPARIEVLERGHHLCVAGDAHDEEVLERAAISEAEVLYCTLPTDAANMFTVLSARHMHPKLKIVTRAEETRSREKLLRAGANRVICPDVIGARRMADVILRPALVDFVEVAQNGVDLEMDQLLVSPESHMAGKSLASLSLPRRFGAHVVAIQKPDGTTDYHPTPSVILEAGDRLILVGKVGASETLQCI